MRSIGRRNIKEVNGLIADAKQQRLTGIQEILDYVYTYLPESVLDTWEGAYTEVENLVINAVVRE